ncbi:uncharacterized protein LOC133738836 [Rosa rugosa]|uniref:uncharacterized protein LOC133738836 n=1 Tax=Rosa rugosa TaxID=74645 RepID=UPI002B405C53|nr:uncharacterized protein LOC133738836 [Rosa rugosa]
MNSIKKKRKKKLQLVSFWQTSIGYVLIASALIASRREDAKSRREEDAKKCGCFVSTRYDRIRGVSKLGSVGYAYPGRIAPVSRIGTGYEDLIAHATATAHATTTINAPATAPDKCSRRTRV